jgi:hypothetical protein
MASEVNRQSVSVEDFSSVSVFPSEPVDLCFLVCAAFFIAGLQPYGCTKQLTRVKAGWPFA